MMNPKHRQLFEPLQIGSLTIKNKFFMPAMGIPLIDDKGAYTNDAIEYYATRARGGVGLIITGAHWVDNEVEKHNNYIFPSPVAHPEAYKSTAVEMTDKIHAFGSKIFAQLSAGLGRSAVPSWIKEGADFIAPSPTTNMWDSRINCREMTTQEIEHIIHQFALAAKVVKEAGFDGVEVHAVHEGYLLDCFAMELFNQRTDKYGGDLRGRLTFAIEILQAIKEACGSNFPVIMRFSIKSYIKALRQGALPGEEFTELGRDVPEALEAAIILQEAGYDAFNADAGTYDSWYWAHPPMYFGKGMYLHLTEQLKKVATVPVMVAGRMDDPDMAVQALVQNKMDAVGLGRPLLADPEYVNKLKEGNVEDIRPCLCCHDGCIARKLQGARGTCAINPECNRELLVSITPTNKVKNVVVVGGGPAGLEAARVSALRGHRVTLLEIKEQLGGSLLPAGAPDFKDDDLALVKWYEHQLKKLNVQVLLGTKADKDNIEFFNPEIVYIAAGSSPIVLNIPGINSVNVVMATDVLMGVEEVGQDVVIVGGGLVGCELALHLAKMGKNITIVEALKSILRTGARMCAANKTMLKDLLAFNNVNIISNAKLSEVMAEGVNVILDGKEQLIRADNIVFSVGFKSNNSLFEELKHKYAHVYNLGDGRQVRNIRGTVWDSYEVARAL